MLEPEDLLPSALAVAAANLYFKEVADFREGEAIVLTVAELEPHLSPVKGVYDALKAAAKVHDGHIDKVGLARAIVALCEGEVPVDAPVAADISLFIERMKALFKGINRKRRSADEERLRHRVKALVDQQRRIFFQDHPTSATREQGLFLFERIADGLDHSLDAKAIRDQMLALTVDYGLDGEPTEPIPEFDGFKLKLTLLKDAFATRQEARLAEQPTAVEQVAAVAPKAPRKPRMAKAKPAGPPAT